MKIRELFESKHELSHSAKGALPNLTTWNDVNNNNDPYKALRFGMMIAGAPDFEADTHHEGPVGGQFATLSYSNADDTILNAAGKKMGIKGKRITARYSTEHESTGKTSPVADWQKKTKK